MIHELIHEYNNLRFGIARCILHF